ncbi:hypothetical protein [Streptomyces aidingensis]|uniref:DUF2384 domain-containing protein n=1 Tax=Streptomyces aidingensis TaxID=910347 RepID=A0A1I1R632_9ACTN|nr:hypothetical protein [Streptomyces aidingensis]SFD25750.1 hypothetical protein SAMN05421773_11211 [Streptomyces aidingensis]
MSGAEQGGEATGADSGAGADELLVLIREHLAGIRAELSGEQFARLCDAVRLIALGGGGDGAVLRLQRALLPLPFDSPPRQAVDALVRAAPAAPLSPGLAHDVLRLLAVPPPSAAGPSAAPPPDSPAEVLAAVHRRLLAAPARPPDRLLPPEADDPVGAGLIRLRGEDGTAHYPEFQFDPESGHLRPVVRHINRLLLADRDPWGAADWWLGGNRWLGGTPAELLGRVPDALLADAVETLLEVE